MDERTDRRNNPSSLEPAQGASGYPRRLVASSARLLDIQYRLWQRDLRDLEQPLTEYGFRLSPDAAGIDGRACRYDASDGQTTILLSGMLLHGRPGGHAVAVDRGSLAISTAWIHDWSPAARLVRGAPADADTLVPRLISWIGGYEQWVLDTRGEASRPELVRALGLEGDLPTLWWRLAAEWRAVLATAPLSR